MKHARTSVYDVVTIGAAVQDIFVRSSHFEQIASTTAPDGFTACFPMGAKIAVDDITFKTGGGATNAAVTFAHFGLKTACIGRVGKDRGGQEIVQELVHASIDTTSIQRDAKHNTAHSIILLAGTGSRAILTARGASSYLETKSIAWNTLRPRWIYLTSLGGHRPSVASIFQASKQGWIHTAWNPGNKEIELGLKTLLPFLMQTDILILNKEEASALAGYSIRHLDRILKVLAPLPRLALVISDGKRGADAFSRGAHWHVNAAKGKVINTTGAGDAFGSAFTASIIQQGDIQRALQVATLNALGVVSHMGAKVGILVRPPSDRECQKIKITEL